MKFTVYEVATGRVLFGGIANDHSPLVDEGQAVLAGVAHEDGWIEGGVHHLLPVQPTAAGVWLWDWSAKVWANQQSPQQAAADSAAQARQAVQAQIRALEVRQSRPMRELEVARLIGSAPPGEAQAALLSLSAQVDALRASLAALP